ncbi:MAG: FKBP-type peptidyl-prolyl cis-trans isomerase [Myxococcales bacterium]|nr:FKBP-type peptidyl-prolyl cis-trans isomerase [Myxococcales bacterium]
MKIAPGCIVTMGYELATESGEIVETSAKRGPLSFMHGKGVMLPGLDKRLEGMEPGQKMSFQLSPQEAFGRVEDAPTKKIARTEFPAKMNIKPGLAFAADLPGGQTIQLQVIAADDKEVEVRMVHPLAGKTLKMSVEIKEVRAATADEKSAGRAL